MFDAEKHVEKPVVALVQCEIQHILQRFARLYRRLAGERERQQGQLHGDVAPIHRGQQEEPRTGKGKLRPCDREMPEGDKAAQHQKAAGMEQVEEKDGKRHRMAEPQGIQPIPLEGVASDGPLAVHAGQV